MWQDGDGIAVLGFKTKMNTISDGVLAGIQQAVDAAEKDFQGLVLWQAKEPFSLGADLSSAMSQLAGGQVDAFKSMVANFQATSMRIKYALVPGGRGGARHGLGGGCEFQMHCGKDRVRAGKLRRTGGSRRRPAARWAAD
jgi:3-hydroxyacyl-CoA dehydrogenase